MEMAGYKIMMTVLGVALLAGQAGAQAGGARPAAPAPASAPNPSADNIVRSDFIAMMDAEFRNRDADNNGVITPNELQQAERNKIFAVAAMENANIFAQLDADRNGMLSSREFAALVSVPPAPDVTQELERLDRDRNRSITIVEHRAATLANFDRLDTDQDGIVTPAEMKAGNIAPVTSGSSR